MDERRRLEEKQKLIELSVDNIAYAVYWLTTDGRFRDVNAAACEMLGYGRDEFLSMSVHDIDPDYSREDSLADLEELRRTGSLHMRRNNTTKDGRVVPVEIISRFFVCDGVEYVCCTVRDITERIRAEKEAAFFRTLIECTSDPVCVLNLNDAGRLAYVNDAACLHFGWDRDRLLSMRMPDWKPTADMEQAYRFYEELRKNKILRYETTHRVASGELVPVEVSANLVEFEGEELAVGFVRNVSRRKEMEAALRRARTELEKRVEERTAELAETVRALRFTQFAIDRTADQAFWMTGDGRFFYVNDAACRALGYTREELLRMSVRDIDPTVTREKGAGLLRELREKGSFTLESLHRAKDGRVYPVEIRSNYVIFDGQEYNCAFVTDIAERKRMEEALRASEAEKLLILDSTMDNVTYHDPEMRIVWANRKLAKWLRLSVEELVGRHCWEAIHGRKEPCEDCPVILARDSGEPQIMEKHHIDGAILYMRAYPIKSDDGKLLGIAEFVSDITERKKAEDSLRKARDELECRVRERTAQLTSLAAELSLAEERERRRIATELHDQVGQPLIMGKVGLDALSTGLPAEEFETVQREIREQISRSIEEIRSLTFQLSPPLLYEVGFEAAVEWLAEEFEERHGFRVQFQDDGKPKPLDQETAAALYRMVRELLVNVMKHAKAKNVRIAVERIADNIRVTVVDDGSGFDGKNGLRRGKKKRGFGLFNIRQRIEYLGGEFAIESKIKCGTRVTLKLPLDERPGPGGREKKQ